MQNIGLAQDYLKRSRIRLKAVATLYKEKGWCDVVRESQEVVELCLKAFLRSRNILAPRVHDVSPVLEENMERFSAAEKPHINKFIKYSRQLRRDRELAFYGSEDLTPSEFYSEGDAKEAFKMADEIVSKVEEWMK